MMVMVSRDFLWSYSIIIMSGDTAAEYIFAEDQDRIRETQFIVKQIANFKKKLYDGVNKDGTQYDGEYNKETKKEEIDKMATTDLIKEKLFYIYCKMGDFQSTYRGKSPNDIYIKLVNSLPTTATTFPLKSQMFVSESPATVVATAEPPESEIRGPEPGGGGKKKSNKKRRTAKKSRKARKSRRIKK